MPTSKRKSGGREHPQAALRNAKQKRSTDHRAVVIHGGFASKGICLFDASLTHGAPVLAPSINQSHIEAQTHIEVIIILPSQLFVVKHYSQSLSQSVCLSHFFNPKQTRQILAFHYQTMMINNKKLPNQREGWNREDKNASGPRARDPVSRGHLSQLPKNERERDNSQLIIKATR